MDPEVDARHRIRTMPPPRRQRQPTDGVCAARYRPSAVATSAWPLGNAGLWRYASLSRSGLGNHEKPASKGCKKATCSEAARNGRTVVVEPLRTIITRTAHPHRYP